MIHRSISDADRMRMKMRLVRMGAVAYLYDVRDVLVSHSQKEELSHEDLDEAVGSRAGSWPRGHFVHAGRDRSRLRSNDFRSLARRPHAAAVALSFWVGPATFGPRRPYRSRRASQAGPDQQVSASILGRDQFRGPALHALDETDVSREMFHLTSSRSRTL
jgi:hypothetical protein